jgi:predicted thioesterase
MINHQITKGMAKSYTKKTSTNDGYNSYYTGTLDYLVTTSTIISMLIDSATDMLDEMLPQDYITVGKEICLLHEHPSLVGETITLHLEVESVEGHVINLKFTANDTKGEVCAGTYKRTIINKAKLLDIAYQRSPGLI